MLSNTAVFKLQDNLLQWLLYKGYATWQEMKKVLQNMVESFDMDSNISYIDYEIILPLYQIGTIEVCRVEDKIYFFNTGNTLENNTDILSMLKAFPSISSIVTSWETLIISNVKYLYSLKYRDFRITDKNNIKYGICKQDNRVWTETFYKASNTYYRIPSYDKNPEGFRIAKCKQHIDSGHDILEFTGDKVSCSIFNTLPIPIVRLLYLADPDNLKDDNSRRLNPNRTFKIPDISIQKQLKRIFEIKEIRR